MSEFPHTYQYRPLSQYGIRLLRLMPHEDRTAPIQCQLFDYSLQESGKGTHLYEALSYAWGGLAKLQSISIDNHTMPVTENLHAALSSLRDRFLERIIWVDAVCIHQADLEEQGLQVQLMAKIYSKAHRVIVWLGNEADDAERALKDISFVAGEESTERSKQEINQQAIFNLLQRPWFQRVWVLQEVAAARHIVIMCGSIEIDGYAFCLGLNSSKLSYVAPPTLPSLTYLIERAGLRSKYTTNLPERFSLEIRHLAELIDMFHTREASDNRDKVYALLGMSSDDPGKAGLRPNYNISWKDLFQQLVKFVLGKDVSVETSDDSLRAVIKSKGCILGQVASVSVSSGGRQHVNITSKNTAWYSGYGTEWTLQASAKSVQNDDIICLLQGASKPTIIRLFKDYSTVVIIAATPFNDSKSLGQLKLSKSITHFPRDFLLVWDWKNSLEELQDLGEYKSLMQINDSVSGNSKTELEGRLDRATRMWNVALILGDLEQYKTTEERLQEAVEGYEIAFKEHLYMPNIQYGQTPLWWATRNGHEAIVKLLLEIGKVEVDSKDGDGRTPLSWAIEGGHEAIAKLLLETGKAEVDSKDRDGRTPLSWATEQGHEAVVKLLLEIGKAEVDLKDGGGRTPLSWATEGGHEAVVKLLLETGKAEVDLKDGGGRTPLSWATEQGHEAVVKLLLETGKAEVDSKDGYSRTPLSWAAKRGHEAVVKLLLETGKAEVDSKDRYSRTPLSWATGAGHEAVVKLLLETGKAEVDSKDREGRTPLSWATGGGHKAIVKLLLKTGKAEVDSKDGYSRTPLSWATGGGHKAIVKLLLETGKAEVDSKDSYSRTPLSWAAEGGHKAVVKLLLKIVKAEVDSKDRGGQTPLFWAAGGGHKAVVKLLLKIGKAEVDSKDYDYGRTPLSWAAGGGHKTVVKLVQSCTT